MSAMPPTSHSAMNTTQTKAHESVQGLAQAFTMIILSEIGDKTFLITVILAMRHPRLIVFVGAFASLVIMSFLSGALGHVILTLVPRSWTQYAASFLFLGFGAKMFAEARKIKSSKEKIEEEMHEAEEEIEEDNDVVPHDHDRGGLPSSALESSIPLQEMDSEAGSRSSPSMPSGPRTSSHKVSVRGRVRNFCNFCLGPVFVQAFVLTFLGEWGDLSQIATITLSAAHNMYVVILGTIIGHSFCTALAVIGGRYISTKISVKHVTYGGSILFLLFGVMYFYEAFTAAQSQTDVVIPAQSDVISL